MRPPRARLYRPKGEAWFDKFVKAVRDIPEVTEIHRMSGDVDYLMRIVVPDIDASLDEQPAKTRFWNAFKQLGPWWAELPPY